MPDWKALIRERIAPLALAPGRELEIVEELAQHLQDRYRELVAGGATEDAAKRAMVAELDEADLVRDLTRVERPIPPDAIAAGAESRSPMSDIGGDLRYAIRALRKSPGFTTVVLLTLALGIGANAAIFSVVNAVILRPLPYRDASRLVVIWGDLRRPGVNEIPASAGEYVDYRDRNRAFEQVAAYDTAGFNLTGGGEPERVDGAITTASLFPLLGATAEIGRTFSASEEQPGRAQVVVLSHALWTRRFHADRTIVGRAVAIDGHSAEVVGVMPPGFHYPDAATEMWKPIVFDADALSANNRGSHGFTVLARLRPGVTLAQAHADLDVVTAPFKAQYPGNYRNGFGTKVRPLRDEVVGDAGGALFVLLGAVGLVLLIACANVANLLLARAASRRKEIALRTALGASRSRLVRQLLTESVLAALAGGALGLVLASWGVDLLIAAAPDSIPRLREVAVDGRVVLFTALVSLATGLLFGLAPAIQASRADLNETLKEGGRTSGAAARGRAGRLLVISEVALSLVLLVAAGLLIRSFARLQDVQPGFDSGQLLTLRIALPESRYTTFQKGDAFFDELFAHLRASPDVRAVAAVNALPFSGSGGSRTFHVQGREVTRPEDATEEQLRIVTDGYFRAMNIPVVTGREFTERDSLKGPRVAVINEALARTHFPTEDPIGKRISFERDAPKWYEIVGIVGNIKHRGLDARDRAELYVPYRQPLFDSWTVRPMYLAVRTTTDPLGAVAAVRRGVNRLDPDQPISDVRTMDDRIDRSLAGRRFNMLLLGLFASLALTLAGIGIYGIVAYSVTERTHEIGVRLALGAQRRDVLAMVVGQGMVMTAIGTAVGLVLGLAATRAMSSLLFGVSATDPATFALITAVLAAVALVACYVPARRATRVDPMLALRHE
jgi:putative ABC transport system permease protein